MLKEYFAADSRRINHALKVLGAAEAIMAGEQVSEQILQTVIPTAVFHDVGIKLAEQKYHSAAGPYQELEGPPVVRQLMEQLGKPKELIERVAYIVGHHHTADKNDGLDFQIIWEADLIVNIEEEEIYRHSEKMPGIIEKNFRTATGIRLAEDRYGWNR